MMIKKFFGFTVPGEPVGKGRPRFNTRSGRAYTPEKTASFENLVAMECARAMEKNGAPSPEQRAGSVTLFVNIYEAMPKSWSKKKRAEMNGAPCLKKPDIDNVVKSVMDGIQRAGAVDDDKQIFEVVSIKRWHAESHTTAVITYWGRKSESGSNIA